MAKEWLDIIDTTVKIGLGALISGVTTYFITKTSHKFTESKEAREYEKQLSKEARERKARIAEQSLENLEYYLIEFIEFIATLDGVVKSGHSFGTQQARDFIIERDDLFLESRAKFEMCQSKLKFIGFNDSALKLNDLTDLENRIRSKAVFEESPLTVDCISEARSSFIEIRKSFFSSLNSEYEKLFK